MDVPPTVPADRKKVVGGRRASPAHAAYAALAASSLLTIVLEYFRGSTVVGFAPGWPVVQATGAALAFYVVWRRQSSLRLAPLLGLGLAFHLAWIGVHLLGDVPSDFDSRVVYPDQGNALLDGDYPSSEYPPGAVLLFALATLLGDGEARVSHAFLMVPFQLLTVVAIWALRTQWSAWFAAVVALWPLNAFFWEFKFDSAPTALLVVGLALAWRERWAVAGMALGLGAAVKWSPALTAAALTIWLVASGRRRDAWKLLGAATAVFAAINAPFLVWSARDVLDAYVEQGQRGITGESLFFIPLTLVGHAQLTGGIEDPAAVPGWANGAAITVQALAVLLAFVVAANVRRDLGAGVAVAAMVPVVFLLTNRVFSPQFLVLFVAAWALAGSLLSTSRRDQLLLSVLVVATTLANVLVYPTAVPRWRTFSATMFLLAFSATAWVFVRALRTKLRRSDGRWSLSSGRGS